MKTLEEIKKEFEEILNGMDIVELTHDTQELWSLVESTISQTKQELIEEIKKQIENFIEDQLYHEVEPRAILNKIPRLLDFILEKPSNK